MVWDRARRAASAYSREVGGDLLTFRGGAGCPNPDGSPSPRGVGREKK